MPHEATNSPLGLQERGQDRLPAAAGGFDATGKRYRGTATSRSAGEPETAQLTPADTGLQRVRQKHQTPTSDAWSRECQPCRIRSRRSTWQTAVAESARPRRQHTRSEDCSRQHATDEYDLLKKYPNLSQNNFLLVDHEDIRNPDGTPNLDARTGLPHQMPLFVPVNPNIKLQMDDETRAELISNNPDLAKTLDRVPTLTPLNMGYLEHSTNHIAVTGAQDHLTVRASRLQVTGVPIDVSDIVSKNPLLRRNAGAISQSFGTVLVRTRLSTI